jgi:hypothetical protein
MPVFIRWHKVLPQLRKLTPPFLRDVYFPLDKDQTS